MARARLAFLVLAGSLVFVAGCSTSGMSNGNGFSLFHRSSRNNCPTVAYPAAFDCCEVGCPVPCCPTPGCTTGCGQGVPLISNAHPPIVEGPALFGPGTAPFPGPMMPQAMAPRPAALPQIVTVPQATMTPSPP